MVFHLERNGSIHQLLHIILSFCAYIKVYYSMSKDAWFNHSCKPSQAMALLLRVFSTIQRGQSAKLPSFILLAGLPLDHPLALSVLSWLETHINQIKNWWCHPFAQLSGCPWSGSCNFFNLLYLVLFCWSEYHWGNICYVFYDSTSITMSRKHTWRNGRPHLDLKYTS